MRLVHASRCGRLLDLQQANLADLDQRRPVGAARVHRLEQLGGLRPARRCRRASPRASRSRPGGRDRRPAPAAGARAPPRDRSGDRARSAPCRKRMPTRSRSGRTPPLAAGPRAGASDRPSARPSCRGDRAPARPRGRSARDLQHPLVGGDRLVQTAQRRSRPARRSAAAARARPSASLPRQLGAPDQDLVQRLVVAGACGRSPPAPPARPRPRGRDRARGGGSRRPVAASPSRSATSAMVRSRRSLTASSSTSGLISR